MELKYSNSKRSSAERGFIGHLHGFRSIYFQGRQPYISLNNIRKSVENVKTISNALSSVDYSSGTYHQYTHLRNYIIYCDPLYRKRHNYYNEHGKYIPFDNDAFEKWCETMSAKGNLVIVSEYTKPKNSVCIGKLGMEKIFMFI